MNKKYHPYYFLLISLLISIVVVYFIAKPFLGPLFLAAVFAFILQPIYRRFIIILKGRKSTAAFLTTIITIILVLLPISLLGNQILKESSEMYQILLNERNVFVGSIENIFKQIPIVLPIFEGFEFNINQYVRQGLEMLVSNFGIIFSSFTKIILNSFVFLIALYFLLKDGDRLKNYLVLLSPLKDTDDEFVVSRLKSAVSAAVKGNLSIGIIQGISTGIGFTIFGVPNPVFWGGIAIITAFIPGVGTALITIPAIIYLFVTDNIFDGFYLLIWGITAVGLIDNLLGPKLIGRGMKLHPLIVFIAVLGGIVFFGPLGFLLGPIIISVCIALIDIYVSLKTTEDNVSI
jgi:predicted PurR-regulated permease PerM